MKKSMSYRGCRQSGSHARVLAHPLPALPRPALMMGLLVAALTGEGAQAACTPASPVSNVTVTCTGTTIDQDGTTGYGRAGDTGNTYDIVAGATLAGTRDGLRFDSGTVKNSGAISVLDNTGAAAIRTSGTSTIENRGQIRGASGFGIISTGTLAVKNFSEIQAVDPGGTAILADVVTVDNGAIGAVTAAADGIRALSSATVTNKGFIGTIGDQGIAIRSGGLAHVVENRGNIRASGAESFAISGNTVDVTSNSGTIQAIGALSTGIFGLASVNIAANSGTISGTSWGILVAPGGTATVNNSGIIGNGKFGIEADTVNVVNSRTGQIQATTEGIRGVRLINLENAGKVRTTGVIGDALSGNGIVNVSNSGDIRASGANSRAINGNDGTVNLVANSGIISATQSGVTADTVNVVNSGLIEATDTNGQAINAFVSNVTNRIGGLIRSSALGGIAVASQTRTTIDNAGRIEGNLSAIEAGVAEVNNSRSGTISSAGSGIVAATANVANAGVITATGLAVGADFVSLANSGTIAGGVAGVSAAQRGTINNSGTISGEIGLVAGGAATITSSGTITGRSGTAIKLSNAADTLTLLPGSRINGVVDMGLGNDVVNVIGGAPNTRLSTLSTVSLPTFINFTGVLNTSFSNTSNANPAVAVGTTLATLDPTALAQADRTLTDFTGGVSSLVQGRLNGAVAGGNMMAMAYAPEGGGNVFTKAPGLAGSAPITVWASSSGGQRTQDETSSTLRNISTAWSAAIGLDRRLRPDWLLGAFIGGGSSGLSVDLGSQTVNTDYVFAGAYSRFEWGAHFVDVTVQGGNADNKSRRSVLNNLVRETSSASYNGWYVSPEVAYGFRQQIGNGYVLTPTVRARYVAGMLDGYSETGSAQSLTVRGRTLQNLEERAELDVSKTTSFFGGEHTLKTNVHGGVIAMQRVGDATVNAVLIGQNLSFATPGRASTVGAVAGAGFDYHVRSNVALFGAIEGMAMTDQSRIGSAKGGLRVGF